MLGYSGHTTRVSSHQIAWNATISWTGLDTGLVTSDRESGAAARKVEGLHVIAGRPFGPKQGSPLHHPHLLPLYLAVLEYHSE